MQKKKKKKKKKEKINQSFTFSLENAILEKPLGGVELRVLPFPNHFKFKPTQKSIKC